MQVKSNSGRVFYLPTAEEDAAIRAGIAADPDTHEIGDEELSQMRRRGRPLGSGKKMQVTLRLDVEVVEKLKATGAGWQTRANDVLRNWVKRHA